MSGDKKLYIQLQYPNDPSVGPVDSGRMDQLLSDVLKHVADYEVTLQTGVSTSCQSNQPQKCGSVTYYCRTASSGKEPMSSALVEVYWVVDCPTSSQLSSLHKTIATSLFGSQSNKHSVYMTVHPAVELYMAGRPQQ